MSLRRPTPAFLVALATAFSLLGDQALYSVLPVIHSDLGLSALQVGLLLSVNRWIRLLTNEFAHRLATRHAPAYLLPAALLLGAFTTALYAMSSAFTVLLLARMLWGLAWSFIRHVGVGAVMHSVPVHEAGRAMGFYNGVSRAGSVAGLFGGALIVDGVGYHTAMLILAGISLLGVPLALKAFATPLPTAIEQSSAVARWPLLLLGCSLGAVGPGFVMSTLGASIASYRETTDWMPAASLTGAVLATRYLLDSIAASWLGGWFDQLGFRRATTVFLGLGAIVLGFAALQPTLILFIGLIVLFFVTTTALHAGVAGSASKLGSGAFARYATANDLGAALGPLAAWIMIGQLHDPFASLLVGAVVCAATIAVVFTDREYRAGASLNDRIESSERTPNREDR